MSVLKSAGDSSKLKAEADVLSGSFLQYDEGGGLNKHKEESARAVNALTLSQFSKQHQQVSIEVVVFKLRYGLIVPTIWPEGVKELFY